MATVTITLTDGEAGDVSCLVHFVGGFDTDSEAHELATELAAELSSGAPND